MAFVVTFLDIKSNPINTPSGATVLFYTNGNLLNLQVSNDLKEVLMMAKGKQKPFLFYLLMSCSLNSSIKQLVFKLIRHFNYNPEAAHNFNSEIEKILINLLIINSDVNARDCENWNALHFLLSNYKGEGSMEIVRLLVD